MMNSNSRSILSTETGSCQLSPSNTTSIDPSSVACENGPQHRVLVSINVMCGVDTRENFKEADGELRGGIRTSDYLDFVRRLRFF